MWEVDVELVADWLRGLDGDSYLQVMAAVRILARFGPGLGRPLVDTIEHSRHKNMKELRPGSSGRSEIRILFAFDPKRRGICLVAGDKQGKWAKWYRKHVPIAVGLYDQHLKKLKEEQDG